ncbi:3-oxoacyl-[acyl-carrier-protein] synthase III C-terminal domain-containing protein [Streptomyces exfoliatus]|uniref:3-oxoacyl-[acyl-carrier-protein] synthase III C-terminal domain-containing protein n=1 Tax=Streptomyces exfoliatus TaxID=1905 RepID=UPI003C2F1751
MSALTTGSMGAASLPLQLAHAAAPDRLRPGTQVVLFGVASGAGGGAMLIS